MSDKKELSYCALSFSKSLNKMVNIFVRNFTTNLYNWLICMRADIKLLLNNSRNEQICPFLNTSQIQTNTDIDTNYNNKTVKFCCRYRSQKIRRCRLICWQVIFTVKIYVLEVSYFVLSTSRQFDRIFNTYLNVHVCGK